MLSARFQYNLTFSSEGDLVLPNIDMAVILVNLPGSSIQSFVSPSQGGSIRNFALIGLVVSEENIIENRKNDSASEYLYYKLNLRVRRLR